MEIRLNALMTHWDLCFIIIVFCEIKIVDFTDIFRLKKLVATWVCTEISRNVSVSFGQKFRGISEVSEADIFPKFRSSPKFRSFSWNLAQFSSFQPIGARAVTVSFSRSIQLSGYPDILKLHNTKKTVRNSMH